MPMKSYIQSPRNEYFHQPFCVRQQKIEPQRLPVTQLQQYLVKSPVKFINNASSTITPSPGDELQYYNTLEIFNYFMMAPTQAFLLECNASQIRAKFELVKCMWLDLNYGN